MNKMREFGSFMLSGLLSGVCVSARCCCQTNRVTVFLLLLSTSGCCLRTTGYCSVAGRTLQSGIICLCVSVWVCVWGSVAWSTFLCVCTDCSSVCLSCPFVCLVLLCAYNCPSFWFSVCIWLPVCVFVCVCVCVPTQQTGAWDPRLI